MRIAFFVNSVDLEYPRYTTTLIADAALRRGHSVYYVTPDDFICRPDDRMSVQAIRPKKKKYKKLENIISAIQGDDAKEETIDISDIDILFLRNDPSLDAEERPWAAQAGVIFGKLATQRGAIVLNDPEGLGQAQNKLYFQTFPDAVRPKTLISKKASEIRDFVDQQKGKVIIKPLQGSGGKNVFMIKSSKDENLNQIIEAVSKEGYVIAQGYISEAKEGDVRLFMMNGRPLELDGKFAAVRRVPAEDEIRSNMHAQGSAEKVDLTETHLHIAELVRPKLMQDGMFLVGLDIVGDKILEINVFSPGALWSASKTQGVPFAEAIVDSLERKVEIRDAYSEIVPNKTLAIV